MKITSVKTYLSKEMHRNFIFIEIETDDGLSGVGEAYSVGPDKAIVAAVEHFEPWLVGEDPRDIAGLWHKLYNFSRFPGGFIIMSAISGIDIALHDLAGKIAGVPVWQLLGGRCRDRVRAYGHVHGDTPDALADNGIWLVEKYGFTAVKCFPFSIGGNYWDGPENVMPPKHVIMNEARNRMSALRDALTGKVDIAVDFHATLFNEADAFEAVNILEPYDPLFIEEPLRPENNDALASLKKRMSVPLATGEMLYSKWQFNDLLRLRAADIIPVSYTHLTLPTN